MDTRERATPTQDRRGTAKRVLLLANETVDATGAMDRVKELVGDRSADVFVVAPALTSSALKHLTGDVDEAIGAARQRLDASLQALRGLGFDASGEIGDSDPNLALEDALRRFPADEVLISTHPKGRSKWLERDVVEKARADVAVPVTHVVVDMERGGVVSDIEHLPASTRDESATATAYDLPRLSKRDLAAIIVGLVGTIALGVLAVICTGDVSEEGMSAGCAIRIGLAIAAFVVTVFHVIALLLFGSVRYRGRANRLAAEMLLYGIPPAIAVSAIVS